MMSQKSGWLILYVTETNGAMSHTCKLFDIALHVCERSEVCCTNYWLDRVPTDKHLNLRQKYIKWRRVHNKTI